MDRFFHVARTYSQRPRFWIFGGWYLLIALGAVSSRRIDRPLAVLGIAAVSAVFACLVMTFVALHVRRQFGTPQAHLMPAFAGPHLTVAAVITLFIWVAVPSIAAWRMHVPPVVMISLHAFVAVQMAIVVWWPKMSVLLAVVPLLIIWSVQHGYYHDDSVKRFIDEFVSGRDHYAYGILLGSAVLAYPLAAWRLKRLSDVAVATSDDFSIEPPGTALVSNPLSEFLHSLRDAHIEWQLGRPALGNLPFMRRRIPSAPAWPQVVGFVALALALVPLGWWAVGDPLGGWLEMTAASGFMLFAPFNYWRFRANALGMEVLRPGTRRSAVRELMLAMASDFGLWSAAGATAIVLGYAMLWGQEGFAGALAPLMHLLMYFGMSLLLLGIGVTTLRRRYWVPLFAGLLVASIVGVAMITSGVIVLLAAAQVRDAAPLAVLVAFPAGLAAIGLVMCIVAYHRWLAIDLS